MSLNTTVCKGLQGVCCQTLSPHGEIAQSVASELESEFVMLPRHPSLLEMLESDVDNKLMYSVGESLARRSFSEQEKSALIKAVQGAGGVVVLGRTGSYGYEQNPYWIEPNPFVSKKPGEFLIQLHGKEEYHVLRFFK